MAATIGNFSSGDVLTAAEMNTLGMEYVGDYSFVGYGGINIGGLADFSRIRVFLYCYLNASTSGLYLQFTEGGAALSAAAYAYAAEYISYTTGGTGNVYGSGGTSMRMASIAGVGSHYIIDVSKSATGPRTSAIWSGNYGTANYWHGSGTYYNAGDYPDGLYIYRTANLATMVAQVYGYQ